MTGESMNIADPPMSSKAPAKALSHNARVESIALCSSGISAPELLQVHNALCFQTTVSSVVQTPGKVMISELPSSTQPSTALG